VDTRKEKTFTNFVGVLGDRVEQR